MYKSITVIAPQAWRELLLKKEMCYLSASLTQLGLDYYQLRRLIAWMSPSNLDPGCKAQRDVYSIHSCA